MFGIMNKPIKGRFYAEYHLDARFFIGGKPRGGLVAGALAPVGIGHAGVDSSAGKITRHR